MLRKHAIRVLLVDDQAIVAEAVRRMLAHDQDIEFYYCQDPARAITTACEISPTVILLDLIMPEIDGLTLTRFLRANERTREIPLIVLSTKEEPTTKAEAFALGANDYLVKLPDKIELIARIRYHSNGYITLLERNEAYEALRASQEALTSELNQAADYVRSLLPPPLEGDIMTRYQFIPSTSLGGDSFGYHWVDDERLAIYLLDVCGHGVGAALLSISAINTLRSESLKEVDFGDPGQVLSGLNDAYQMEDQNNMFFTIWYGVYDKETGELTFASAGHPPPIAVKGEAPGRVETALLRAGGFIIGGLPGQTYENVSISLGRSTRLYIYSDGIYEVPGPDGTVLKMGDFFKIVTDLCGRDAASPEEIIEKMKGMQDSETFEDDVSLMEVTILRPPEG
ncbi:MAG: SpoIIE family protein phosphatase [Deltaproteobacteria bacterium]|nr:SpoIIE family protein phosphatase [Deltaproteobacteria bacterium]MBW2351762.1 SpoIIE family protein phosphatase [Deltaproteobacteria bacterium]HDZ91910.1 response regulator [Deltaproteobacteria bacterium]